MYAPSACSACCSSFPRWNSNKTIKLCLQPQKGSLHLSVSNTMITLCIAVWLIKTHLIRDSIAFNEKRRPVVSVNMGAVFGRIWQLKHQLDSPLTLFNRSLGPSLCLSYVPGVLAQLKSWNANCHPQLNKSCMKGYHTLWIIMLKLMA